MKPSTLVLLILGTLAVGCAPDPKSGTGFTLPDGSAERGQQTFVQLQCHACHTVSGLDLEPPDTRETQMIALGGLTPNVKTYGDLVTSIINPSHRFAFGYSDEEIKTPAGESKMRLYNDEMTIAQLIDLVAFLQSRYEVEEYQPTPYAPYY